MQIQSSFPSKLILFGEHSVVHGYHSILIPLSITLWVGAEAPKDEKIIELINDDNGEVFEFKFDVDSLTLEREELSRLNYTKYVFAIAKECLKKRNIDMRGCKLVLKSLIPRGGFGGSASFTAGIVDVVLKYHNVELSKSELLELVIQGENFQHGNSSGADPTVIVHNKPIIYSKSEGKRFIDFPSNIISILNQNLFVIQTGRDGLATKDLVDLVAKFKEQNSEQCKLIFDSIEQNIADFLSEIGEIDLPKFKEFINTNGRLLEDLGVVSNPVVQISQEIRSMGGAVKVSGAGGVGDGGSGAVIVVHEKIDQIFPVFCKYLPNSELVTR